MARIIELIRNIFKQEQVPLDKEVIQQTKDLALLHRLSEAVIKNIPLERALKTLAKELRDMKSPEKDNPSRSKVLFGCFIELGDGQAGYGEGNFYASQAPDVTLRPPAKRWHWVKEIIEKYWLWRWFSRSPQFIKSIGDQILFG